MSDYQPTVSEDNWEKPPMVRARRVTCPYCGAVPGNPCWTSGGKATSLHRARVRLARRAMLDRLAAS